MSPSGRGIVAIWGLNRPQAPEPWTAAFLISAILATLTGFLFPFIGATPAFLTGTCRARFVLIAQAFQKLPPLNALAPTGSEPPFAIAQLICLAVFAWIGYRVVRHARTVP